MSNGRHSKLAPSAAHRWSHCTASVKFVESLQLPPEPESEYAKEGTLAHETFATALGLPNPFKVAYGTPQEKEYLPIAIEYVQNVRHLHPEAPVYREHKVNPAPYVQTRHCKGTADVIIPVEFGPLYVIDLKFGEHVAVDVIDNDQLILYGLGALAEFSDYVFTEVVLVILQPRAYHPDGPVREWRVEVSELEDKAPFLAKRAREALNNGVFRPETETVCRWCPGQGVCKALADYSMRNIRETFEELTDTVEYKDIDKLSNHELAWLLDQFPALRRWMQEVSTFSLRYVQNGGSLPGYTLRDALGNRTWAVPPEDLDIYFAEEVLYERRLRTPPQVEKLAGKRSVDAFVKREITGQTLVKTDSSENPEKPESTLPFGELPDAS